MGIETVNTVMVHDKLPVSEPNSLSKSRNVDSGFERAIAYFSMEIGYSVDMPTYSGGLGVLAGDTLRAAADLNLPMVAVALLHRKGYFRQVLDEAGHQREEPEPWAVERLLEPTGVRSKVRIEGRVVHLTAWTYTISGANGGSVPVYLLDTDLPENSEWDRKLTDHLYGGDAHYRLCQEIVLGIGGVRLLGAMGYGRINRFHCNEGHAALLFLELLNQRVHGGVQREPTSEDVTAIRRQCLFTTHTPVPAGHDRFTMDDVQRVLDGKLVALLRMLPCVDGTLNMTHLAMHLSGYVNGVSLRHAEVSRRLFEGHTIDAVTNGVHPVTWVSPLFAALFDRHVPGWRKDSTSLRHALSIPYYEIWSTHRHSKQALLDRVRVETQVDMDVNAFTIGFARRTALYKRADLLLDDPDRLRRMVSAVGPLQIIFSGKAHPHDDAAKDLIKRIYHSAEQLRRHVKIAYLVDYDMELCRLMTSGVDLWVNTPEPPLEASGTSGMKAALNGVPSLSILDGWWVEGCIEGVTGWSIGTDLPPTHEPLSRAATARVLYDKLEFVVLPLFYRDTPRFVEIMKHAIGVNGSYFTTHRMVQEYLTRAYLS